MKFVTPCDLWLWFQRGLRACVPLYFSMLHCQYSVQTLNLAPNPHKLSSVLPIGKVSTGTHNMHVIWRTLLKSITYKRSN